MKLEKPSWPQEKQCVAMISLNLNAELFWLDLDSDCADKPKTLSLGQYGMNRGLDRILDVLDARGIRATVFVPGRVCELYPEEIRKIAAKGHELGVMGHRDENMALYDTVEENRESISASLRSLEDCCGVKARGFRSPQNDLTRNTLRAAKDLGLDYSSNLCDDDRPYQIDLGDGQTITELPVHWVNYDLPYFAFNYHPAFPSGQGRIANYTAVLDNWTDEFDGCREYGLLYDLQLDPAMIGAPGRVVLLEDLLDHMLEGGDVWFATGSEIADHYRSC